MNEFDVLLARKLGGGSGDTYTKAQIDAKLAEKVGFSDYATANAAGIVKPDGVTTVVGADGTLSVAVPNFFVDNNGYICINYENS